MKREFMSLYKENTIREKIKSVDLLTYKYAKINKDRYKSIFIINHKTKYLNRLVENNNKYYLVNEITPSKFLFKKYYNKEINLDQFKSLYLKELVKNKEAYQFIENLIVFSFNFDERNALCVVGNDDMQILNVLEIFMNDIIGMRTTKVRNLNKICI